MAFSTLTVQPASKPIAEKHGNDPSSALLSMLMLSVYAAQKSKKAIRKLQRRFMWTALKLKVKSLFSKKYTTNDHLLIYILLGVVALVLVFYYPLIALLVAVIALILILTHTI